MKPFANELRAEIEKFFDTKFYNFNTSFYYSNILSDIENYSRSITSARLVYELSIEDIVGREYFNFQNAIVEGSIRSSKLTIPQNVTALSIVDKAGVLYLDKTAVGTVDYETGLIQITNTTISSTDNFIEIFVTPVNDDVIVSNRSVITLDKQRLAIELGAV